VKKIVDLIQPLIALSLRFAGEAASAPAIAKP